MILSECSQTDLSHPYTGIDAALVMSYSNDMWGRGPAQHLPPTHNCEQNRKCAQNSCQFISLSKKQSQHLANGSYLDGTRDDGLN